MKSEEGVFWQRCMFSVLGLSVCFIVANIAVTGNEIIDLEAIKISQDNTTNVVEVTTEIHRIVQQARFHLFFLVIFNVLLLLCSALLIVFTMTAFRPRDQMHERLIEEQDNSCGLKETQPGITLGENVISEGLVYEPYTQATLNILATEDSPPFTRVSRVMYRFGPNAAKILLQSVKHLLTDEEVQYLTKMLYENK